MSNSPKLIASCYQTGEIKFTTDAPPEGTLVIATHEDHHALRVAIATLGRHGYGKNAYIVPGLRMPNGRDPVDILIEFKRQVEDHLPDHRLLLEFGCAVRVDKTGDIWTTPLGTDNFPIYDEFDELDWTHVTDPEGQEFLDAVNGLFEKNFDMADFK